MPNFHYKAKKGPTEVITGVIVAANLNEATGKILGQGFAPLEVTAQEIHHHHGAAVVAPPVFFVRRVPLEEIAVFTRQLGDLLEAGVPLLWGFAVIAQQTHHVRLKEIVEEMATFVKNGGSLSGALAQHPTIFPPFYVNMVKAGELGGRLTEVLARLAQFIEKDVQVRAGIRAGIAYPLVVLGVGVVTIFVLLTFVLPRLSGIFEEFDAQLPLITQAVMGFSHFMSMTWFVWIALVGLGIFWGRRLLFIPSYRMMVDSALLKAPIVGEFLTQVELGRFGRTLGTLLENGISIVPAMEAVSLTIENNRLRQEIADLTGQVKSGKSLTNAMRLSPLFSEMAMSMIAVAEESGKIYKGLFKLADACERRTESLTKTFVTLLGPAVLVVIVVIVGFVILAMLLPIFQMNLIIN